MAMTSVPNITLNNGRVIPTIGLGTNKSFGDAGVQAVRDAIDAGYRLFDTAYVYGNETAVAQAIREKIAEGVVCREEIFIVTKLWNTFHHPDHVKRIFLKSLANTGLDYIDLYLIHFPISLTYHSDTELLNKHDVDNSIDLATTWREMENLVKLGLVRSIGLSNFNSEQVQQILDIAEIKPVINQVECSPVINQKELTKFCLERDIRISGYCPLRRPKADNLPSFLCDERVLAIGRKYDKTPAQIVLRYLVELGTIPIPKSASKTRILENIQIFDFELTADEMLVLDTFHTGERLVVMNESKLSKNYPFSIPF